MSDFEGEDNKYNEDEEEVGFADAPNPHQIADKNEEVEYLVDEEEPKKPEPPPTFEKVEEEKKSIKIDIDSVDKLIGGLRFATIKLNESADKIAKNEEFEAILEVLSSLKAKDLDYFLQNFDDKINSKLNSINFEIINKKIDKIDYLKISKKIDTKIQNNINILDKSSQKLKNYTNAFNDDELFESLDKLENIEIFLKKFKKSSIIFSCIFGFFASFLFGYLMLPSSPVINQFLQEGDYTIVGDGNVTQLWLPKQKFMFIEDSVMYVLEKRK